MDYDVEKAFAVIENELIDSMIRNLKRHTVEEIAEDMQWEQWQALQLKALDGYRKANPQKYGKRFDEINAKMEEAIRLMEQSGQTDQEAEILKAISENPKLRKRFSGEAYVGASFFRLNESKLEALIQATRNDMQRAEQALLRRVDDRYRQIIFNAHTYANMGAGTYAKAADMATKDFLSRGIDCIEYSNGARHTISDYAAMALRTAGKRAYLMGQGQKRDEWGIHTVIVNRRGNPCPMCLPFVGKILIDDVYGGGSRKDGDYMLLSEAMAAGFLHPNCKDSYTAYFQGITDTGKEKLTGDDVEAAKEDYMLDQKQQYAKRNHDKFQRLAEYSLDEDNRRKYRARADEWGRISLKNDIFSIQKKMPETVEKSVGSGIIKAEPASRYFNTSEDIYRNAQKVKPIEGYEDIFIHGDKMGFAIKDLDGKEHDWYAPREFAEILKDDPNYQGGNIRLLSCEAGAEGAIAAQFLSNQLGVQVLAPSDVLWIHFDGSLTIGPDAFTDSGSWIQFTPER